MEYARLEKKGIIMIIEIDKISESGYYQDKSFNLKMLDDYSIKREWQFCFDAKLKGVFVEKYIALSKNDVKRIHNNLDKEVEYLDSKLPKIPNGGIGFGLNLFQ